MTDLGPQRELLVVLSPDLPGPPHEVLAARGRILHRAGRHVVVLGGVTEADVAAVRALDGVRWAGTEPTSGLEPALDGLDPGERVVVAGWRRRSSGRGPVECPDRTSEGLPWDAPGRLPPDPPDERGDEDGR